MSLHPPFPGFDGWAIILGSLVLPAGTIELLHRNLPWFVEASALSMWGAIASLGFSMILAAVLFRVRSQLRRVINLAWMAGTLHLTERSMFKPCAESWTVLDPQWLRFEILPSPKFARLWLTPPGCAPIQLIDRAPAREVEFIYGMLITAISRPQKPASPTPVPPA